MVNRHVQGKLENLVSYLFARISISYFLSGALDHILEARTNVRASIRYAKDAGLWAISLRFMTSWTLNSENSLP